MESSDSQHTPSHNDTWQRIFGRTCNRLVEWLIPLLQFKYKGVLKRPFGMKNAHLFIDPDGSEAEVLEK